MYHELSKNDISLNSNTIGIRQVYTSAVAPEVNLQLYLQLLYDELIWVPFFIFLTKTFLYIICMTVFNSCVGFSQLVYSYNSIECEFIYLRFSWVVKRVYYHKFMFIYAKLKDHYEKLDLSGTPNGSIQ